MGLRVITFKLDERFLERIDLVVERLGITRSDLIRAALESFIKFSLADEELEKLDSDTFLSNEIVKEVNIKETVTIQD